MSQNPLKISLKYKILIFYLKKNQVAKKTHGNNNLSRKQYKQTINVQIEAK